MTIKIVTEETAIIVYSYTVYNVSSVEEAIEKVLNQEVSAIDDVEMVDFSSEVIGTSRAPITISEYEIVIEDCESNE